MHKAPAYFSTMTTPTTAPAPVATYPDYLHLSYRPDLQILLLRWLRDATLAEVQAAHQAVLEMARLHGVSRWFVDVRRRQLVNEVHSRWVGMEFLPRAAAALQEVGTLRIAYLMSPSRKQALDAEPDLHTTITRAQSAEQPYRLRVFLEESAALPWLLDS